MKDLLSNVRWFFGQTMVWIWGDDLLDVAKLLSGAKRLRCYGLRIGPWALYAIHVVDQSRDADDV